MCQSYEGCVGNEMGSMSGKHEIKSPIQIVRVYDNLTRVEWASVVVGVQIWARERERDGEEIDR